MQLALRPINTFVISAWLLAMGLALQASAQPMAQVNQIGQKMKMKASAPKAPPVFSSDLSLTYSQSLIDHEDGTIQRAWLVEPSLIARLAPRWSLKSSIGFEQDIEDQESEKDGVTDLTFTLGHGPHHLASWVNGSWSLTAIAPTSEYSSKELNLRTTLATGYGFSLNKNLVPDLEAGLGFGVARNFHQYETSVSGAILNPYSMKEFLSLAYTYRKWTFAADLISRHAMSYNNEISQSFQHSQEISFKAQPAWSLAFGHTNSGNWLKDNQQDLNLKLVDEDDSIVYASTRLAF